MTNPKERHSRAMDLAEKAHKEKDNAIKLSLFNEAYELERELAEAVEISPDNEPTRSILYRSAACLASLSGRNDDAKKLALAGLSGFPPRCVAQELFDVLFNSNDQPKRTRNVPRPTKSYVR